MFNAIIYRKAKIWLNSSECKVKSVIEYIRKQGHLRDPQIEAIEIYLFLKIEGRNKPLWQLFSEGFFSSGEDFSKLPLSQEAREIFENNHAASSFFEFVRSQNKQKDLMSLSESEKQTVSGAHQIDYTEAAKNIFYGVDYADYLFSLPMGAGKTYLMAALVYLDLYFAQTEPDNKLFAHNFLVLAPSGLKSSIVPSLRTIENFDPTWVVPEPMAGNLKKLIKFEVLDEAKTAKKSNKTQNPNAQKILNHQPLADLIGLIMVVNAEKVILDRVKLDAQQDLIEKTEDQKDEQANELRNIIGKIPNLQIYIDEVHHATDDEIKLRKVVNGWNARGNVNSVLGFSGTPYSSDKVALTDDLKMSFSQITNTVYFFSLVSAIRTFLKKPTIKAAQSGLMPIEIVREGVKDFYKQYQDKIYANGTRAKLAIYCGKIERLEEEIYPFLTDELKIPREKILKFHKGNKDYKIDADAEMEFRALDTPQSEKEIILLVQIGKEGWDCQSLTGVVLSNKSDCPTNMVLQTSCRCLRQVEADTQETAIIWLNQDNAKILQKQLEVEQHTSITEINNISKKGTDETRIERFSRLDHLKLPPIDFFQYQIKYENLIVEERIAPLEKITAIDAQDFRQNAVIIERDFDSDEIKDTRLLESTVGEEITFSRWLLHVARASFGKAALSDLRPFEPQLKQIFGQITKEDDGSRYFNNLFDRSAIEANIRLAFYQRRDLETRTEIIPAQAKMLIVERLKEIADNPKLYPNVKETAQILELDAKGQDVSAAQTEKDEKQKQLEELLRSAGRLDLFDVAEHTPKVHYPNSVLHKERTFHFLPYNFAQSGLEKTFLERVLSLDDFKKCDLEIFFNGEKDLTDFRIECFEQKENRWQRVGLYTPDFLVIERKAEKIHRVLIIETKGSGFAEQKEFLARRKFVETEFLKSNNEKYGYEKFEYLYLTDADSMDDNLLKFREKLRGFFCK
jgi:hypothetical protein